MLARLGTMEPMSTQPAATPPATASREFDGVIFDLGGVMTEPLFHHRTDVPPEFFGVIAFFLGEFRDHYHLTTGVHDLHLLEMGKISDDEFFDRMIARYIEAGNGPMDPREAQKFVFGQGMVACGAMVDAVRQIRDAGFKTALLTNISREGEAIFTKLFPVDELFDVVVDSSKVGMRKPDPAIYRLTCERLGIAPERCLVIDDLL
jgi:putative hydrolase of the HAD superfamily